MRHRFLACLAAAACLGGCAMPQQTASSASAERHHYHEPTTGSLFDEGDTGGLSSGMNDPGMNNRQRAAGGH